MVKNGDPWLNHKVNYLAQKRHFQMEVEKPFVPEGIKITSTPVPNETIVTLAGGANLTRRFQDIKATEGLKGLRAQ